MSQGLTSGSVRLHRLCRNLLAACITLAPVGAACSADLIVEHIAPYSGPAAAIGKEYGQGARLYFDYVNAHGGIQGSRVLLIARDDAGDVELTRTAAAATLQDHPVAFIGTVSSTNVDGLIPTLRILHAPLLGPVVSAAGVSATGSPYVFHIRPAIASEVESLAKELYRLGLKKIALCGAQDGPTANAVEGARIRLATKNIKVSMVASCDGDASMVQSATDAIVAGNSQAVVFPGGTEAAATFIKTLRAKGSFAMVAVSSSVDPKALVSKLPPESLTWLAVAQSVPNPGATESRSESIVREFRQMISDSSSAVPLSRTSLAGFLTAKISVEAIRRAGKNPTCADVLSVLAQLHDYDAGGLAVNFARAEPGGISYTRLGIIGRTGEVLN